MKWVESSPQIRLPLPDQIKLVELLENEGVDFIQTEGGKCSNSSKAGILGLIEKGTVWLTTCTTFRPNAQNEGDRMT